MLSKKTVLSVAAALAMGLAAGSAYADMLKIGHIRPQGAPIDVELHEFASNLKALTSGSTTVKIFAASALGDYTNVQEQISFGAIDMAVQPAATAADRRMQLSSFPYLAENWAAAKKLYGPGGAISEAMKGLYAKQGITMLVAYPVYFSGIALNRAAVSPGDPNVAKGIKLRVPSIKSFQLTGDALGYISTPISWSETFTAVQTGVVDGVIGAGAEGYYASLRDVTKTYIPANIHFEAWYMIINSETLAGLSDGDRAALMKAAEAFSKKRWGVAEGSQAQFEQKLVDAGATRVNLTDAQLAAMAAKVRAEVWPQILEDVDANWARSILGDMLK